MPRSREKKGSDEGPQEGWLATYGDMMTLLLCFFVLLFSMSTVDVQKFQMVIDSLRDALSGVMAGGQTIHEAPLDKSGEDIIVPDRYVQQMKQLQQVYNDISKYLKEAGLSDAVLVQYEDRGLLIRFSDSVLFEQAKARLQNDAKTLLKKIGFVIQELPNEIIIEGHTDNLPLRDTSIYPSNWELSTARATSVAKYLIEEEGIMPERIGIAGYAEYHPIASNNTAEGRQQNRRVDVVIKKVIID